MRLRDATKKQAVGFGLGEQKKAAFHSKQLACIDYFLRWPGVNFIGEN